MATNRGVVYMGPGKVEVQSIDFPKLALGSRKCEHGVILKIVSTNICGSDQHMVRGRTTAPQGLVLGHEITGEVIEKGRDVEFIKVGDLVSVPFNIACGRCRNCKEGKNRHLSERESVAARARPTATSIWVAGSAVRPSMSWCPYADFNLLKFPDRDQGDGEDPRPDAAVGYLPDRLSRSSNRGRRPGLDRLRRGRGTGRSGVRGSLPSAWRGGRHRRRHDSGASGAGAQLRMRNNRSARRSAIARTRSQQIVGVPEVDCAVDCVGFEARGHGHDAGGRAAGHRAQLA